MDRMMRTLYATLALSLGLVPGCGKNPQQVQEDLCPNPVAIEVDGQPTGFATCDGQTVREEPQQCALPPPDDEVCMASQDNPDLPSECMVDADCTDKPNGYCGLTFSGFGSDSCACNYACTSDADCEDGYICDCGALSGDASKSRCVPAECDSRDSCDGFGCVVFDAMPYCGDTKISCQTAEDTCVSDADCGPSEFCIKQDGVFTCVSGECAIGRPFVVDGTWRMAGVRATGAVALPTAVAVAHLTRQQRDKLGEQWSRAASLEHASIAAFARFALQLLAQGAPAELVVQARRAIADEARHAQLCLALAQAYCGQALGFDRLDTRRSLPRFDFAAVVEAVVVEGCIGETVAAALAAALAAEATDPVVRETLQTIAADELRHAGLAWRYLAWVGRQPAGRQAYAQALAHLEQACRTEAGPLPTREDTRWAALGYSSPAHAAAVRASALRELVAPLVADLRRQGPQPADRARAA